MDIIWLLFSFKGRINRQPYWAFMFAYFAVLLLPVFFTFDAGDETANNYVDIVSILLIWPVLAIQAKRWHDRDKSAWWILINLVPVIGGIWALIENGFLPGTESENRFGENPISAVTNEI